MFTILLPVTRPPATLPFAIETVLSQTVTDFELFIVCDGAPDATVECARSFARRDTRVREFPYPKGQRHGEAHRHAALQEANGEYVAHICDDDLWLPNHLDELGRALAQADFTHTLATRIFRDEAIETLAADIGSPEVRQRMLSEPYNLFGPTQCGYRMNAYRQLSEGWAPAPLEIWTDLHMWRKFFLHPEFRFETCPSITAASLEAVRRSEMTLKQRASENSRWLGRLQDPRQRDQFVQAGWQSVIRAAQAAEDLRYQQSLILSYERLFTQQPSALEKFVRIEQRILDSPFRNDVSLPSGFDPLRYIALYPDLFEAEVDPYEHYILFGRKERRACSWRFASTALKRP